MPPEWQALTFYAVGQQGSRDAPSRAVVTRSGDGVEDRFTPPVGIPVAARAGAFGFRMRHLAARQPLVRSNAVLGTFCELPLSEARSAWSADAPVTGPDEAQLSGDHSVKAHEPGASCPQNDR